MLESAVDPCHTVALNRIGGVDGRAGYFQEDKIPSERSGLKLKELGPNAA